MLYDIVIPTLQSHENVSLLYRFVLLDENTKPKSRLGLKGARAYWQRKLRLGKGWFILYQNRPMESPNINAVVVKSYQKVVHLPPVPSFQPLFFNTLNPCPVELRFQA